MTVSADKSQRRMMIALPLVFVAFIINFPAGLILYWITTNTWTIAQQYIVRKTVGPMRPPAAEAAPAGAKAAVATSGNSSGDGKKGEVPDEAKPKRGAPPPQPPRRKKKARSGRRR
jgi:YidC/Oxa1 family membrane protein insertase